MVLTVTDDDGASNATSENIYIDTYPPWTDIWVHGVLGENGWYVSDYVAIGFLAHDSGSGIDRTMYRLDGGDWHEYGTGTAIGVWQNGEHVIEYYSIDNAGNEESVKSYGFKLDNTPPEVTVLSPNGGETLNGTIAIAWSAIDNCDSNLSVTIEYSNDAGSTWHLIASNEPNDGEYEWNTFGLPDGTNYLIKISTSDEAGNTESDASDETFAIHNPAIPPSVAIVKPRGHLYIWDRAIMPLFGNTTIVVGAVTVAVTAESDTGIAKVEFYIDDELKETVTGEPYQWLWDEPSLFTHTIKVIAFDNAGNTATDEQEVWIFNF